jgi:hypothetical protein
LSVLAMIPYGAINESRNSYQRAEPDVAGNAVYTLILFFVYYVLAEISNASTSLNSTQHQIHRGVCRKAQVWRLKE